MDDGDHLVPFDPVPDSLPARLRRRQTPVEYRGGHAQPGRLPAQRHPAVVGEVHQGHAVAVIPARGVRTGLDVTAGAHIATGAVARLTAGAAARGPAGVGPGGGVHLVPITQPVDQAGTPGLLGGQRRVVDQFTDLPR